MPPEPRQGRRALFTLPRIVMSLLLALSLAGIIAAFAMHDEAPNPRLRPQAVRAVSPQPGSLQLRQTEIFVELTPAYRGTLTVNGIRVPEDQMRVIEGLNRYSFTPGEGLEIEELPPGRTCASVEFRTVANPSAPGGHYRWCFSVS